MGRRLQWRPRPPLARGGDAGVWGRGKLLASLGLTAVTALALLAGFGLAISDAVRLGDHGHHIAGDASRRPQPSRFHGDAGRGLPRARRRDAVAERPLPALPPEAARPGPLSTEPFPVLVLPTPRVEGPAGVATGLPHSSSGALAQLVAIDQAAVQSASVPGAQAVVEGWAVPGGPTPQSWTGVRAVAEMLTAAGQPDDGSPTFTVSATPAMGLLKGTVGRDYVVACVDFVVTATGTTTSRVAAADCQRMVWTHRPGATTQSTPRGRWMIGPGAEPAPAAAVWPGTTAAHAAGYRELRDG